MSINGSEHDNPVPEVLGVLTGQVRVPEPNLEVPQMPEDGDESDDSDV